MDITVSGILENFKSLIQSFGYIPNGGLLALSARSQPPVFAQMVHDYVNLTGKDDILESLLPALDREYEWWWANRTVDVSVGDGTFTLFQYRSEMNCPRPEAYTKDILDARNSTNDPEYVWSSIVSSCESGWDFSTRWFAYDGPGAGTKAQTMTRDIIPVDLNAFMCKNLGILVEFHEMRGSTEQAKVYRSRLKALKSAVEAVLWNESDGIWYDYDLNRKTHRRRFYPSNFFPMYGGCVDSLENKEEKIWGYTTMSGAFNYPGGVPTSLNASKQQWDFPNGWSPLIHVLVEGFRLSGIPRFTQLAFNMTSLWVQSNYLGFTSSSKNPMWEKYDVRFPDGRAGGGGEYEVQEGFGWTNGVVLDFFLTYGDRLRAPHPHASTSPLTIIVIIASILLVCAIASWYSVKYCEYRKYMRTLKSRGCCTEEGQGLLSDDDF